MTATALTTTALPDNPSPLVRGRWAVSDTLTITTILFLHKVSTQHGANAQYAKILGVHRHTPQMLGSIPESQVVANLRVAGHVLKGFAVSRKPI